MSDGAVNLQPSGMIRSGRDYKAATTALLIPVMVAIAFIIPQQKRPARTARGTAAP